MSKTFEKSNLADEDMSIELSLAVLREKLDIAQASATKIPAENVQKIVEAFATVDLFLQREEVREIFQKSNTSSRSKELLIGASHSLDVRKLKKSERDTAIKIAAVAIAAGFAVSGLFGLL